MKVTSTNDLQKDKKSKYYGRKYYDADYKVERTFDDHLQEQIDLVREMQRKNSETRK